jgi:hypothetical protein
VNAHSRLPSSLSYALSKSSYPSSSPSSAPLSLIRLASFLNLASLDGLRAIGGLDTTVPGPSSSSSSSKQLSILGVVAGSYSPDHSGAKLCCPGLGVRCSGVPWSVPTGRKRKFPGRCTYRLDRNLTGAFPEGVRSNDNSESLDSDSDDGNVSP